MTPSVFAAIWPDGRAPEEFYAFPGGSLRLVQGYSPSLVRGVAKRQNVPSEAVPAVFGPRLVVDFETRTFWNL